MTEKVLGFVWNDASELYVIEKDGSEFDALEIRKSKLVPVVSLEACEKEQRRAINCLQKLKREFENPERIFKPDEFTAGKIHGVKIAIDLLEKRLEASK